ncbi:Rab proteins geranylgeranyltransferase component A [Psilocybe cubensis]|uniref:Rab proteins geranylgeranyltransferase component A n=1 Tax=Psilocybe cubensis TaxID=181762 RepID=A0ACB8H5F3_PSICU|nr:Rab proteins geranylgeranyltransferase component A [Psilocybe cubensis]KAH9482877.1 Rab proteins geranylgeranyltransferase component A [Psilocybe cubensis]
MEENQFDVVIFGTGLVESIVAAALSKAGYKVAHIDSNSYYGGDEASLSLDELVQWADGISHTPDSSSRFQRVTRSTEVPSQARQYSICLRPAVLSAMGPLISSLIMSGVAKYSGFRLLDCVSVYDGYGRAKSVPGSKEDIFKSKEISLIEKRRLMRFLTFAAADFVGKKEIEGKENMPFLEFLKSVFSLSEEVSTVIVYSLAFCMSSTEPTIHCLHRLQKYLRSGGRYGPSPFLIGHYGGIGDIAQGFCRAAAVSGGVYILARQVTAIVQTRPSSIATPENEDNSRSTFNYAIDLEDFPDTLSCNLIISSPPYIPPDTRERASHLSPPSQIQSDVVCIARCIAIIDQALSIRTPESATEDSSEQGSEDTEASPQTLKSVPPDTAIVVFPPSSVSDGSMTHSATALINGEGSMSTPKGKWIIYIALPLSSVPEESVSTESIVRPYLNALLLLGADPPHTPVTPLFTTFYLETSPYNSPPSAPGTSSPNTDPSCIIPPTLPMVPLPDIPDEATTIAENTFKEAVKYLRSRRKSGDAEESEIAFWPPIPVEDEEEDNDW